MKELPRSLYHISPKDNRQSIVSRGLLPEYAPVDAKRRAVWAVEPQAVIWAILHTSARHMIPADQLHIWQLPVNDLFRCHAGPIWYSLDKVYPLNFRTSAAAIDDYAAFLGALT